MDGEVSRGGVECVGLDVGGEEADGEAVAGELGVGGERGLGVGVGVWGGEREWEEEEEVREDGERVFSHGGFECERERERMDLV